MILSDILPSFSIVDKNIRSLFNIGLEKWDTGASDFNISGSIRCLDLWR